MDIFILELVSNHLTVPVKIDGMQQHAFTFENRGPIKDKRAIFSALPSWKTCEAGWRCA